VHQRGELKDDVEPYGACHGAFFPTP
jgi:hypothetical protein